MRMIIRHFSFAFGLCWICCSFFERLPSSIVASLSWKISTVRPRWRKTPYEHSNVAKFPPIKLLFWKAFRAYFSVKISDILDLIASKIIWKIGRKAFTTFLTNSLFIRGNLAKPKGSYGTIWQPRPRGTRRQRGAATILNETSVFHGLQQLILSDSWLSVKTVHHRTAIPSNSYHPGLGEASGHHVFRARRGKAVSFRHGSTTASVG